MHSFKASCKADDKGPPRGSTKTAEQFGDNHGEDDGGFSSDSSGSDSEEEQDTNLRLDEFGQANNVNAQVALNKKLGALQKAQEESVKIEKLPDGRVRYYTKEAPSKNPGPTRGASHVTEFNSTTGRVRSWHECYDQAGKVNRVHPKSIDGQEDIIGQHYPPTKAELVSFSKKIRGPK